MNNKNILSWIIIVLLSINIILTAVSIIGLLF